MAAASAAAVAVMVAATMAATTAGATVAMGVVAVAAAAAVVAACGSTQGAWPSVCARQVCGVRAGWQRTVFDAWNDEVSRRLSKAAPPEGGGCTREAWLVPSSPRDLTCMG
jgi:hypothetical protein